MVPGGVAIPKIHRVSIENFRRIRDRFEAKLLDPRGNLAPLVTLAGPNGCGKTSVLEAILLGLGLEELIVRDLERSKRQEHWRIALEPRSRIEVDAEIDGEMVRFVRTATSPPSDLRPLSVEYFSSWRAPELVGPVKPLAGAGARPADTENNRLWRLKQRINDVRATAGFGKAANQAKKADEWLARLNVAWRRLHGDDGTSIDANIVDGASEELFADLFVMRGETRLCAIDQVSAGEIELLSIAGLLILNDFRGGLVLIDEPELHMHAQWQTALLPALRELAPEAQFIVASHSDAVWNQTPAYSRFLLVPATDPRSAEWPASPKDSQ